MINISFSGCLTGSLKMADYYAKQENSEIQNLKENLFSLWCLDMDLGDISELMLGDKRRTSFMEINGGTDYSYRQEWFNCVLKDIAKIEKMVKKGHEVRIWYSERASELCAFCWMLSLLDLWGIKNEKILYVKLPQSILFDDGQYEIFGGSGMFEPELLAKLVFTQRYLTQSFKECHIRQWNKAQEENSDMRIVLNGQIVSVSEDFYDSIIISQIGKMDKTFKEITAIANSLGEIWTSINFVAWRIDKMIESGLFEIVEEAKSDEEYYRRTLREV